MIYQKFVGLGAALVFVFVGCVTSSGDIANSPHYPRATAYQEEIETGNKIHAQITSSFYVYTDSKVTNYVHSVGSKLVAKSKAKDVPYQFTVLYSDEIYASFAPGGHIYVTTAMLYFLQNEAELAAVLATELALLDDYSIPPGRGKKIFDSISKGAAMVAPAFGQVGALTSMGWAALMTASKAMKMKPEEKIYKASQKAMYSMISAGYDPQGLLDFSDNALYAKDRLLPLLADYNQSHFLTAEHRGYLEKSFRHLPLSDKTLVTNFKAYEEATRGIREIYRSV